MLPVISLLLVTYFAVHLMHGARGLNVYFDLQHKIQDAESNLNELEDQHHLLDARLARISPGTLDRDLLDELTRENLGLSHEDERTIFIGRPTQKIGKDTKAMIVVPGKTEK